MEHDDEKKKGSKKMPKGYRPPALTAESQENYMISLAVAQAEEMLLEKKAPTPVLTHYLKLATVREQLALKKLEAESELMAAKKKAIDSDSEQAEMYKKAVEAMMLYQGRGSETDEEENIF